MAWTTEQFDSILAAYGRTLKIKRLTTTQDTYGEASTATWASVSAETGTLRPPKGRMSGTPATVTLAGVTYQVLRVCALTAGSPVAVGDRIYPTTTEHWWVVKVDGMTSHKLAELTDKGPLKL